MDSKPTGSDWDVCQLCNADPCQCGRPATGEESKREAQKLADRLVSLVKGYVNSSEVYEADRYAERARADRAEEALARLRKFLKHGGGCIGTPLPDGDCSCGLTVALRR